MVRRAACLLTIAVSLICRGVTPAGADCRLSSAPSSRWRLEIVDGVHWLVTPGGEPFFSVGIDGLSEGSSWVSPIGGRSYLWSRSYATRDQWLAETRRRVFAWGFNTAGAWSVEPRRIRLPSLPVIDLGVEALFHWMDPLSPETETSMLAAARRLVAPYQGDALRIGYFTDNEVGWWNGPLFRVFMDQPATNYTKSALVRFLAGRYRGDWQAFVRDFVVPAGVVSFDDLRAPLDVRLRPGSDGIQTVRQWAGVIAGRYYQLVRNSLRGADPDALVFGDRLPTYYDPVVVRAMVPYVDAIATNYNVDSADGWLAPYYFDALRQLSADKPILISEWFFAAAENRTGNANNGLLMTVRTQRERATGAAAAAQRFAAQPNVVGIHWFQYFDHPRGGRPDGEDYNFGLVDVDDLPYEQLTAALAPVNRRLAGIHRRARVERRSAADYRIPRARIDAGDGSLAEWPKPDALVPGMVATPGEVPFADFLLAWDPQHFHLGLVAMEYYDPLLLPDHEEFPRGEAFRVDLGIDAGAGPVQFAAFVIPPREVREHEAPKMHVALCRVEGSACEPVSEAVATYIGSDQPRIIVELSIPWSALGTPHAPRDRRVRVDLATTAWHRSRWISWSGAPPEEAMVHPENWRSVALGAGRPVGRIARTEPAAVVSRER